jgi:hypothetical protein
MKWQANIWGYNREARGGAYFIRKGRKRRNAYLQGYSSGVIHWEESDDLDFDDYHFGKKRRSPCSDYTPGTPGIADWRPSAEAKYPQLFLAHAHAH